MNAGSSGPERLCLNARLAPLDTKGHCERGERLWRWYRALASPRVIISQK